MLVLAIGFAWISESRRRSAERDRAMLSLFLGGGEPCFVGQRRDPHFENGEFRWVRDQTSRFDRFIRRNLAAGRSMHSVHFRGQEIRPDTWNCLEKFPELRELEMHDCRAEFHDLARLREFRNLEQLTITGVNSSIGTQEAEVLGQLTQLKSLYLSNNTDEEILWNLQAALPECKIWPPLDWASLAARSDDRPWVMANPK
jgi:hypothetical protein